MTEPAAVHRYPDDYPYYRGVPVSISGPGWWLVMAMVVLGFLLLVAPIVTLFAPRSFFETHVGRLIPILLYCAVPLLGLRIAAGRHWTAIFRRVGVRSVLWMIAFALLTLVVSLGVGLLVSSLAETTANPAHQAAGGQPAPEVAFFFLRTGIQLFGEEVMSILPFLALLSFLSGRGVSRRSAVLGAWLISAVLFGAAHLPTYDWNVMQSIVLIGSTRLVLTGAYMVTKNIWVSTGAHILNDWIGFAGSMFGAGVAG